MVTLEVGREQRKPFRERKRVSSVRMEVALIIIAVPILFITLMDGSLDTGIRS